MKQLASLLRLEINLNDIAALLAEKAVDAASESLKSITLSSDVRMTGDFTCDLTKLEGSNALNFSGDAGQTLGLTINFMLSPERWSPTRLSRREPRKARRSPAR